MKKSLIRALNAGAIFVTLGLSACGGSSDPSACASGIAKVVSTLNPGGCPSTAATATTTTAAQADLASLQLVLTDSAGASTTVVSPDQPATVKAVVKDSLGSAAPGVAVTFLTTDPNGLFVPVSGTALTDVNGVAAITLRAGAQAGAFTVSASTTVSSVAIKGTAGYTVAFPALTLSAISFTPSTLSAGGNAGVSVTVSNGVLPYAPPLPVSFTSACISAGKATLGTPVLTQNGTATASYSDKGCGVADVITASVTLGGTTVTQIGTITVLPAAAGSIKFVAADTTNIALKGTGGIGRQEFSSLTFQVFDTTGNPVSGKVVDFVFSDAGATTVGGLSLNPLAATSGADGRVTTLVLAGVMPTSVRVVASVRASSPLLTTLSNVLVVSTGVPDQKHFSLSSQTGNCEGRDFDQTCSVLTATLGDYFGNPVPDGTAVNFTTEAGIVDASCITGTLLEGLTTPVKQTTNSQVGPGSGTCSVLLRSSGVRPSNGRVTVLAYAIGEEDFSDNNGNNAFDTGDTFTDKSPDIFRDDNENGVWTAGEPCVGLNRNGSCSSPGDGQYNGVLRIPQTPAAQTLYVSGQLVQTFSGSAATITLNPGALTCTAGQPVNFGVRVTDVNGNVMPAGTKFEFSTVIGSGLLAATVFPSIITVNNVVLAVGEVLMVPTYTVTLGCPGGSGTLFVTVTTPNGIVTRVSTSIN